MAKLNSEKLQAYLKKAFGKDAVLLSAGSIGNLDEQGMKSFGYGKPLLVRFMVSGGKEREIVLSTMKGDKYGHQFYWDRAAVLMFQHATSARLEKHVKPLALGFSDKFGNLHPVNKPKEFFLINEKLEGHDYFLDLDRMAKGGFVPEDEELAREFGRWLARIHSKKKDDPDLYFRRIRELIGSSECILGLVDEAFPHPYPLYPDDGFSALEKKLVDWRWKLRGYAHRLSAVHGDFHPWNVMLKNNGDFSVLDRSRGEWGEPGGDLVTMATNYLLWSIREHGKLAGPFKKLYTAYFSEYLEQTNDEEVLSVLAPFFVFRCLVIASPEWYPDHSDEVRFGLFRFMENVLEEDSFDWENINRYME